MDQKPSPNLWENFEFQSRMGTNTPAVAKRVRVDGGYFVSIAWRKEDTPSTFFYPHESGDWKP